MGQGIEFLQLVDPSYPASTAIKIIPATIPPTLRRNQSLARYPTRGRFEFTFTPKHGSWLNLVEGFFSKLARSVLRHIRVASKHELAERIAWPPSRTSTSSPSSILGLTSSKKPLDMIQSLGTLY